MASTKKKEGLFNLATRLGDEYVQDEVTVVFKEETSVNNATVMLEEIDAINEKTISEKSRIASNTALVEVSGNSDAFEAIYKLGENSNVAPAQPNYLFPFMFLRDEQTAAGSHNAFTFYRLVH